MPPPPPRSSSRSVPSTSRASSGGSAPRSSVVPTLIAVAVVGLIVGGVIFASSGKKPVRPALPSATPTPTVVKPPAGPAEKPYPAMPTAKLDEAAALVKTFEADGARAQTLYQESQTAKQAGDETAWQTKLKEALGIANRINTKWNDFIATLPHSQDYDEEEVAKHYFPKQGGLVTKLTGPILRASKTDEK